MTARQRSMLVFGALALAFGFRLAYGLTSTFWTEDERQVYLIGLRSFARGEWPYFGADVVWTGSNLPGALQGLLIRGPLSIWHAPEAPLVLLNLLSFGALCAFAWYLCRRTPLVPKWIVWGALLTLPWTLNFSTHVVNVSYILPGAVVFFIGFLEAAPSFRIGAAPTSLAWLMMGAGIPWVMQIHMSWVLLPAYVVFAVVDQARRDRRMLAAAAGAFAVGALLTGSTIVPTLIRYGVGAGSVGRTVQFQAQGLWTFITIVARFLSFAAFETNRFVGLDLAERLLAVWRQPWIVPFVLVATVAGLVQPVVMAAAWFVRSRGDVRWGRVKWLAAATVVFVFVSFFFSVRGALAHAFYVVSPVAFVYAAHCWQRLATPTTDAEGRDLWWRVPAATVERMAAVVLVCGVIMHAGLAIDRAPRQSLYVDRSLVQTAITAPNDRFLGDRRDSLIETQDRRARPIDPVADAAAYERASAGDDLVLVSAEWSPAVMGRVSRFRVELRNAGATAAYLDLRYATRYRDAAGTEVATRQGVIKEILQPGSARAWADLTDGMVPAGAVSATLSLESAEKCIPARGATPKPDNAAFPDTGCQALSTPNTGLSSCQWLLERTSRPRDGKGHWAEQARGRPAAIARGYGAVVVGQRVVDQDVDPIGARLHQF